MGIDGPAVGKTISLKALTLESVEYANSGAWRGQRHSALAPSAIHTLITICSPINALVCGSAWARNIKAVGALRKRNVGTRRMVKDFDVIEFNNLA